MATHLLNVSRGISVGLLFWNADPSRSSQHGLTDLFLLLSTNKFVCFSLFEFVLYCYLQLWLPRSPNGSWNLGLTVLFIKLLLAIFEEWKFLLSASALFSAGKRKGREQRRDIFVKYLTNIGRGWAKYQRLRKIVDCETLTKYDILR